MLVKRKEQRNEKKNLFICKMDNCGQSLPRMVWTKERLIKKMSIETAVVMLILLSYIIIDKLRGK